METHLPAVITHRVAGTVTDGANVPVAGASVAFWSENQRAITFTDGTGAYQAELRSVFNGTDAFVEKEGFEPGSHWVSLDPGRETVRSLRIHRIVAINAGEPLHLQLRPDEGACGFDLEFWCRRIRVRSTSTGTLTMRVDRDGPGPDVSLVIGMPHATGMPHYPYRPTPTLSIAVSGNTETLVDVLVSWGTTTPLGLTLSTSLE
jgi:hypothetical protein